MLQMLMRTSGDVADVDEDFPDDATDDLETIETDESVAGIGEVG